MNHLKNERKLIEVLESNPFATKAVFIEELGFSKATVERVIGSLIKKGVLIREGANRNGRWVIVNN